MDKVTIGISHEYVNELEKLLSGHEYNKEVTREYVIFDLETDWKSEQWMFTQPVMEHIVESYLGTLSPYDYVFIRLGEEVTDTVIAGTPVLFNLAVTREVSST